MDMEKKIIIQWTVFVVVLLTINMGAAIGLSFTLVSLIPVIGAFAAVSLIFITSAGFGVLMVYMAAKVGVWLADRGWFM
jgi:hypothetical protein